MADIQWYEGDHVLRVNCIHCHRSTDRVIASDPPFAVCIVFYLAWTHTRVEGCPDCVRKRLLQLLGINLFTANLLFVFVGPIILGHLAASYRKDAVAIAPEHYAWAEVVKPARIPKAARMREQRRKAIRFLVVFAIAIAVVLVMLLVLPQIAK